MTATPKLSKRDKVFIYCSLDHGDGKPAVLAKYKGDVCAVNDDGTVDVNVHVTFSVASDDGGGAVVQDHRVLGGKSHVRVVASDSTEENTCWPRSGRWGTSREGGRLWIPEE